LRKVGQIQAARVSHEWCEKNKAQIFFSSSLPAEEEEYLEISLKFMSGG